MKARLAALAAAVLAAPLAAAAVLTAPLPVRAADPLKVGVNLELSGVSSTWGQPQLNSIQMYVDEANARGGIGGRRIELEVLDNKSDPAQSRLNVTKLAGDGVVAILGAGTTPTTMPAVPVANESGVPMISNGAGNVITSPAEQRHWIFKTPNDDSQVANKIAGFLAKQKLAEVAFLSVNTAYGDSGKTNFAPQAARFGLKLVAEEKYGPSDTDVTAQLTKFRDSKAQAVVVWGQPPAVTIIAKNAAQLGLRAKLIYSNGAAGASFVNAGKDVAGTYLATTKITVAGQLAKNDPQRGILQIYADEYKRRFHAEPDGIAAFGADGIRLLLQAMRSGGTDRKAIRDALESKISNFPSYSGRYTITASNHQGLAESDIVIAEATGSGWKIAER